MRETITPPLPSMKTTESSDRNRDQDNNTDTTPTLSTLPHLLTLPAEIQSLILGHLPWPSLTTLRLTHNHFAHSLLPQPTLPALHTHHQELTFAQELHHLQCTLGYTNPNWCGFTQGWGFFDLRSLFATLPCYHCLRWLPAADKELGNSAFCWDMATKMRDLGMTKARERVCVECGVRAGLVITGEDGLVVMEEGG